MHAAPAPCQYSIATHVQNVPSDSIMCMKLGLNTCFPSHVLIAHRRHGAKYISTDTFCQVLVLEYF